MNVLDLLDPTKVVNEVVIGLILAFAGLILGIIVAIVGGIVVFNYKWKRAEESKQKEKLEQEKKKEMELENEKKRISAHLLSEIELNQNQLKPLADCATNLLGNGEVTDEKPFPNELNFYNIINSNLSDKLRLLGETNIKKSIIYYSKLKHIEEEYKKLETIHGFPSQSLAYLELSRITKHKWSEIEEFLINTKKVYELGEELIQELTK